MIEDQGSHVVAVMEPDRTRYVEKRSLSKPYLVNLVQLGKPGAEAIDLPEYGGLL